MTWGEPSLANPSRMVAVPDMMWLSVWDGPAFVYDGSSLN
jgi:hypothetical protein